MERRCENCRHFSPHATNGQATGDCRAHPPTTFMIALPQGPSVLAQPGKPQLVNMNIQFPAAFPLVQGTHWCGEFNAQVEGVGKEAVT